MSILVKMKCERREIITNFIRGVFLFGLGFVIYFSILIWNSTSPYNFPFFLKTDIYSPSPENANSSTSSNITTVNPSLVSIPFCIPFPKRFETRESLFHCDWDSRSSIHCRQRLRASLSCKKSSADILFNWVDVNTPPALYQYNDTCLERVVKQQCYDGNVIPRLMHFVSFSRRELPFYGFLSVLSAVRFLQPCLILYHGDFLPFGHHWDILVKMVPNILHVNRSVITSIYGKKIKVIQHSADVARLEAIIKFGGVYMDSDHILLNSLEDLRNYSAVMGIELRGNNFGNGMFLGKPNSEFLQLWMDSYHSFDDNQWAEHSTRIPKKLHDMFPHLELHVVDSFFKPHYENIIKDFYQKRYDWTKHYGMHLYNGRGKDFLVGTYETHNSSLGEVTRHILFGNKDSCFAGTMSGEPVRLIT